MLDNIIINPGTAYVTLDTIMSAPVNQDYSNTMRMETASIDDLLEMFAPIHVLNICDRDDFRSSILFFYKKNIQLLSYLTIL